MAFLNRDFTMRRPAGTLVLSLVLLSAGCDSVTAPPASPIVNGEPDGTGHPDVGALLYDFDGDGTATRNDLLCSGTFVGATRDGREAFLTAGHCLAWGPRATTPLWVTFDPDLTDGVAAPVQATGFVVDPGYGHDEGDLHDLALVFLPPGGAGVAPAPLPSLDRLGIAAQRGGLRGTLFENVGYGATAEFRRGPTRFSYPDMRLVSLAPFMGLTKSRLGLLINHDATGLGGDCFGDSGSPKFIQGSRTIVAVVSWGDVNCRATSWNQRVDTPSARAFLGRYLTLP